MLCHIFTGSLGGYELKKNTSPPKCKCGKGLQISASPFPDSESWGIFNVETEQKLLRKRRWNQDLVKCLSVTRRWWLTPSWCRSRQETELAAATGTVLCLSIPSPSWDELHISLPKLSGSLFRALRVALQLHMKCSTQNLSCVIAGRYFPFQIKCFIYLAPHSAGRHLSYLSQEGCWPSAGIKRRPLC